MIKTLTKVGNSKAVILPSELVKKYNLEKVMIEETEDGILIRSAIQKTDFQMAVEKLRQDKDALYKRIESQANEPETIEYYAKSANIFSDVDLDIIEE
jgi:antitoxin component of MazEF toxin-antitoxin module